MSRGYPPPRPTGITRASRAAASRSRYLIRHYPRTPSKVRYCRSSFARAYVSFNKETFCSAAMLAH